MANSVYTINREINKPIEFRGLKAQYIGYLAVGILVLLLLFVLLYFVGIPTPVCLVSIALAGTVLVIYVYRMSSRYGQYGMMKKFAQRRLPKAVRCNARKMFILENGGKEWKNN